MILLGMRASVRGDAQMGGCAGNVLRFPKSQLKGGAPKLVNGLQKRRPACGDVTPDVMATYEGLAICLHDPDVPEGLRVHQASA
jgi:hypothetical protein